MSFFLAGGFDEEVEKVTEAADDEVAGGNKLDDFAAKASFEGGDAGVAMVFLTVRGDAPEIIAFDAEFFEVFDDLPLESIGAREFMIQLGRGGFKVFGFDAANQDKSIGDRRTFGSAGDVNASMVNRLRNFRIGLISMIIEGGTLGQEGFEVGRNEMLAGGGFDLDLMKLVEDFFAARPVDCDTEFPRAADFVAGLAAHLFQEVILRFLEVEDDGMLGVKMHRGLLSAETGEELEIFWSIAELRAEAHKNTFLTFGNDADITEHSLSGFGVLPIQQWSARDFEVTATLGVLDNH